MIGLLQSKLAPNTVDRINWLWNLINLKRSVQSCFVLREQIVTLHITVFYV